MFLLISNVPFGVFDSQCALPACEQGRTCEPQAQRSFDFNCIFYSLYRIFKILWIIPITHDSILLTNLVVTDLTPPGLNWRVWLQFLRATQVVKQQSPNFIILIFKGQLGLTLQTQTQTNGIIR